MRHNTPMIRRHVTKATLLLNIIVGLSVSGCDSGNSTAPTPPHLLIEGRVERGLMIDVRLILGKDTTNSDSLTLSFGPASAATVQDNGRVKLNTAGPLTISAVSPSGRRTSIQVEVAIPPRIVFDFAPGGARQVYQAALDGADIAPITTHVSDNRQPTAVGTTVVFTSFRNGRAQLYQIPLAGGTEQRITNTAGSTTYPALNNDKSRIAYLDNASGFPRVRTSAADGTNVETVTTNGAVSTIIEASPGWDPASLRLVFTSTGSGRAKMMFAAPGGVATPVLPASSFIEVEPAWSADGKFLAFVTDRAGPAEIYMLELATGTLTRLTTLGTVGQPSWLKDGRIVFVTQTGPTKRLHWIDPTKPNEVFDIPVGAGNPERPQEVR